MLSAKAKLSKKIFHGGIDMLPTRDGYGLGLVWLGENNPNVVVLTGDLSESTRSSWFAEKFPKRFIEVGVAEQNMMGIAAGLALSGKIPFVSSYATFNPGRNWDQLRVSVAYSQANVKVAGAHAGISVWPDGATHQALEDIATMRAMPNMIVISPADAVEAKKATIEAAFNGKPTYIRLAREKTPVMTTPETLFKNGRAETFWEDKDPQVAIVAAGPLLYEAL